MNYYNCFSTKQMKFLNTNGQIPIDTKIHTRTQNTYWIYEKNDELDKLLTQWSNNKPN